MEWWVNVHHLCDDINMTRGAVNGIQDVVFLVS